MRLSLHIVLLCAFLCIVGCKSKHVVTESSTSNSDSTETTVKVDTVIKTVVEKDTVFIKVKDPQSNNIVITDPCDSLTGLLRKFQIRAGNTTVSSQGGGLSITTKCDSVVEIFAKSEKEKDMLIRQLREALLKYTNQETKETKIEKTGFIGWMQKLGITLSAALYVSFVWVALFIFFWLTGKIDINL